MNENPFEQSTLSSSASPGTLAKESESVELRISWQRKLIVPLGLLGGFVWAAWPLLLGQRSLKNEDIIFIGITIAFLAFAWWLARSIFIRADADGVTYAAPFSKRFVSWGKVANYSIEPTADLKGRQRMFIILKDAEGNNLLGFQRDWVSKQDTAKLLEFMDEKMAADTSAN